MLVLSRKPGESLVIDGRIEVFVVESHHGGRVRLGIVAPPDVPVHRREIQDRIDQARKDDAA